METIAPQAPLDAKQKRSAIIKWAFIAGIMIVINLFLGNLVQALYHEPLYTDFCPEQQVNRAIESESACLQVGGQWNENVDAKGMTSQSIDSPAGYCDPNYTCMKGYTDMMSVYNRNVFVVFVVAGVLLLIGSVFLSGVEAISLGLSFGGVLALIIGSVRYWSDMNEILRVILLGAALAGLIYVAWKKFKD